VPESRYEGVADICMRPASWAMLIRRSWISWRLTSPILMSLEVVLMSVGAVECRKMKAVNVGHKSHVCPIRSYQHVDS
jgi:hypothetical protein